MDAMKHLLFNFYSYACPRSCLAHAHFIETVSKFERLLLTNYEGLNKAFQ